MKMKIGYGHRCDKCTESIKAGFVYNVVVKDVIFHMCTKCYNDLYMDLVHGNRRIEDEHEEEMETR